MDPRFLFSLSIQTERGPTSVRLFYANGYFRLDAQPHLQTAMPEFHCVVQLVQHYVLQSKTQSKRWRNDKSSSNRQWKNDDDLVWVDADGKWYSSIVLDQPLRKQKTNTLKHLARLAINKSLYPSTKIKIVDLMMELPMSLKAYLAEYPYCV